MKVLVIVALFAFVAVQVCQSAPVPDEDKAENVEKKEEPAAAAPAVIADVAESAAPAAASSVPLAETNADPEAKVDAAVPKASDATPLASVPAEEKKDA